MDVQRPSRKKEIRRKRILYGVMGAVALVAVTFGINSLEPAAREVEADSQWIQPVKRGEMVRSVRGPGTLVPEEIRWIAAETEGRVERIHIDPGATVTAGDLILTLSNPTVAQTAQEAALQLRAGEAEYRDLKVRLESELLDQQANLARVNADYKAADLQVEADRELFDNGLIADIALRQSELAAAQLTTRHEIEQQRLEKTSESIEAQLAVQRSSVEQLRALYDLRRRQLEALEVRASIAGVLQQVPVEEGQQVAAGANLARVAVPGKLEAQLRVNETQAKDILVGQVAEIDTRNGKIEGKVRRIDPAVQQGSVRVDVQLVGELPKGARPDLSVDGTIIIDQLDDVLYIARPPYGQANSTIGLFRLDEAGEYAYLTQVQIGLTSVNFVEVLGGLEEGDRVILSDTSQWDDADRVRLR